MAPINVLVAATSNDVMARIIAHAIDTSPDMNLIGHECISLDDLERHLRAVPVPSQCALVLMGPPEKTDEPARRWLKERANLVVVHLEVRDDIVRIMLRDPNVKTLLATLRGLVTREGGRGRERVARVQLRNIGPNEAVPRPPPEEPPRDRPLLRASIAWVHHLLREAVESLPDEKDAYRFAIARKSLLDLLDERDPKRRSRELVDADADLDRARNAFALSAEPLAVADRVFGLDEREYRALVLALAPELDLRYQQCIGMLLDEAHRRVGTPALSDLLLGAAARRGDAPAHGGALSDWLAFEGASGRQVFPDEPLRLDPFLARWLIGDEQALLHDPRLRRVLRLEMWPGATLLQRREEFVWSEELITGLRAPSEHGWIVLEGELAATRACCELFAGLDEERRERLVPVRVEPVRLAGADAGEIEDCARRIGRLSRLARRALVIDLTGIDAEDATGETVRRFFGSLASTRCTAAVLQDDRASAVKLLGGAACAWVEGAPASAAGRVDAIRAAAKACGIAITQAQAEDIARRHPLRVDALEGAMRLAQSRAKDGSAADSGPERFIAACRDVAAEGISNLAERVEPLFELRQVVLPEERHAQLREIVDNVLLAPKVLDEWKFREQLPYGRGVAALFYGASGTGKTMAAIGIARSLDMQLLRLNLARNLSKFLGDTEKHIDRVFTDAERSGSVLLIDEADALLGKRSEVKDAHDRYANIEVAFLLQRLEAFEGLAILTTNMKQALDPAFVRRIRFMIEFPRPDAAAREKIWRQCLPAGSFALDDAAFRQLARKIDLTGGHIRQITLRAAFLAAAEGVPIGLTHIARASRAELAKLGMPPVELDAGQARNAA